MGVTALTWSTVSLDNREKSISRESETVNKKEDKAATERETPARRKIMKSLAAGGAVVATLPAKWTTPLVDSVVVPAHAGSSPADGCGPPCGSGSSSGGASCSITAALIDGGSGALIVVGEATAPADCKGTGSYGPPVECELIHCGNQIGSNFTSNAGGLCTFDPQSPNVDCIVSCSVEVDSSGHEAAAGDCVTLRFTIGGSCTCSAVDTIS